MTTTRRDEPRGPSPHEGRIDRGWLLTWSAITLTTLVVFAVLWAGDHRVELVASVGAVAFLALAVVLHHLVVTQDAGDHQAERTASPSLLPRGVARRRLLAGAGGVLIAALAGLIGIQRNAPRAPRETAWFDGSHLVTLGGTPLHVDDVPEGGVVTVWPEGAVGTERAAVMLIRLREPPLAPTQLDGVVGGQLVAYSRLCTHAGCAVALYRDRDQALFCPCHQATFDARRGATPTAGPASVALPQLPISVDEDGYLIATADLSHPPGPVGGTV
jgi:ubiquinol-cytochrome c reductase iron-sulfur subunit